MANYTATLAKNATTLGGTVDTVTLRQDAKSVEVVNRGGVNLYCRTDGTDPSVDGDDCRVVLPGSSLNVATPESTTVVKVISATPCSYSIFEAEGEGLKSVSNTSKVIIDTASTELGDAFGRQRVSTPQTLIEVTHELDPATVRGQTATLGTGTFTHLPAEAALQLSVGTTNGQRAVEQSRRYLKYQPGKGLAPRITSVFGPRVANVSKRSGYFDDSDGIFVEENTSGIFVKLRSSTGAGTASVPQSSWNIDKLDGYGPSGKIVTDLSLASHFVADLQWLAVGRVRVGFEIDGSRVYVHEFNSAFSLDRAYMRSGSLPVRWEIVNTGTSAGASMKAICATVISEGGHDPLGYVRSANTGITGLTVNTTHLPLLSIRPKLTYGGVTNRGTIQPVQINIQSSGDFMWELYYGPTLTGPSWTSVGGNSLAEYDKTATAITTTTADLLASGYKGTGSGEIIAPIDAEKTYVVLGPDGTTQDILTLAVTSISGNITMRGSMLWREEW